MFGKKNDPPPPPKKQGLLKKAWEASTDAAARPSKTFGEKHTSAKHGKVMKRNVEGEDPRPAGYCFCGKRIGKKTDCGKAACHKKYLGYQGY